MKRISSYLIPALVFLIPMLFSHSAQAQNERIYDQNANGWYMYFGDHKFTDKWGIHAEVQLRRHHVIEDPQQLLLRTGINYDLAPTAMLTLGYGYIETHPYGDFPAAAIFPEHRTYQQLQIKGSLSRLGLSHRYRLEQRWVKPPGAESSTFLNRARYMVKATLPIAGETLEVNEPYLAAYEEVFISFGENVRQNIFDQNRAYAAIGYKISNTAAVELGYLNQLVQKANGTVFEVNHTLQVSLFHNLNFARED